MNVAGKAAILIRAQADCDRLESLLVEMRPHWISNCHECIQDLSEELARFKNTAPAGESLAVGAEMRALVLGLARVRALMDQASRLHGGWAQIGRVRIAGYSRQGQPGAIPDTGRRLMEV